jgi:polar amino acid transport system substrate-binding protein
MAPACDGTQLAFITCKRLHVAHAAAVAGWPAVGTLSKAWRVATMKHLRWRAAVVSALMGLGLTIAAMDVALAETGKCEPEKLATKYPGLVGKKLKIGQDGESPPYSFRDPANFDNVIGFDADFSRAVFTCIGVPIEFHIGGWSGLLPSVIAGQSDAMWDDLYYTAERAKQVDYVVYMIAGTGILVKAGNPKHIQSIADACGLTATAGLGTVEEAAFRDQSTKCQAAGKPAITILTFPDIPAGTRLMQTGRADLLMNDLALVDKLALDSNGQLERGVKIVSDFKIGVAVKKGRDDLLKAIYEAIAIRQEDGTQKTLYDKYKIDPALAIPAQILRQ